MKITETITRECCTDYKDFSYLPCPFTGRKAAYRFCVHCGRHWEDLGGTEPEAPGWQPLPWPWETKEKP